MRPQVSIIIPAYNYAQYVPATIRSVLLQEGVTKEILVVDDGSTDSTAEVAGAFADAVRYIYQKNKGPAAARNTGLRHASGETVIFLDADDLILPGTLASQYATLMANPEYGMVGCLNQEVMTDGPGAPLRDSGFWPLFHGNTAVHLCHFNIMPIHSVLCKKSVCDEVGFFDETLRACEDHEYWLRCALAGYLPLLNPHALVLYRKHASSLSAQKHHEYLHNIVLHEKVHTLLMEHAAFPAGQRVDAWIAHAAGCLVTGLRLFKSHPQQAQKVLETARQALKMAAREHTLHSKERIATPLADQVMDFYAIRIMSHLHVLLSYGLNDFAVSRQIMLRLFPQWNVPPKRWEQAERDLFTKLYVPQQLMYNFDEMNALVLSHEESDTCETALPPPALPRLSVVMATYNAATFLERGLNSIVSQSYENRELIVQDGKSTDATCAILNRYQHHMGHCASERDAGVYDAWNRALQHVTGDWVLFLGADDFLANEQVFAHCAPLLAALPKEVLFAFGAVVQVDGKRVVHVFDRSVHDVMCLFTSNMGLPFPGTFVRASLIKACGFDTTYRIAGDFAFAAQHITLASTQRLPVHISYMEEGGLSSNPALQAQLMDERKRVLHEIVLPRSGEIVSSCIHSLQLTQKLW